MGIVQKLLNSDENRLIIHKDKGCTDYYEINNPYMLVLEISDDQMDEAHTVYITPGNITEKKYRISQELENRVLHQHDYYELMYVLKGKVFQRIEDQQYEYTMGHGCLLNCNIRHVEEKYEDSEIIFLAMKKDFVVDMLKRNPKNQNETNTMSLRSMITEELKKNNLYAKECWEFTPLIPAEVLVKKTEQKIGEIVLEIKNREPGFQSIVEGKIIRFLATLSEGKNYRLRKICPKHKKEEQIFREIQNILNQTNGMIERNELEALINYDAGYLNHIVKRLTGKNFTEYKKIYRLQESARLLVETEREITQIVEDIGFANRSYFYRIFKEQYGMTPKEYREKWKKIDIS